MKIETITKIKYEVGDVFLRDSQNNDPGFYLADGIYVITSVHSCDGSKILHLRHILKNVEIAFNSEWIETEKVMNYLYNMESDKPGQQKTNVKW